MTDQIKCIAAPAHNYVVAQYQGKHSKACDFAWRYKTLSAASHCSIYRSGHSVTIEVASVILQMDNAQVERVISGLTEMKKLNDRDKEGKLESFRIHS